MCSTVLTYVNMMCICRLVLGLLFALFVWYLPTMRLPEGHFATYFYVLLFLSSAVHQVFCYLHFHICYYRSAFPRLSICIHPSKL